MSARPAHALTAGRSYAHRPGGRSLVGWWLALMALLALNLQGMLPYSPGMLQDPDLCSTRLGTASSPGGTKAMQHAGCGLCCARAQAPLVPAPMASMPAAPWVAQAVVVSTTAAPSPSRAWWPSRPRGPPLHA